MTSSASLPALRKRWAPAFRRAASSLTLIFFLFLSAGRLPAQAPPDGSSPEASPTFLDTITVTATRTPTSVQEAPGSVSVLAAERIEREVSTDARDLVRYEPGVYVEGDPTRLGLSGFNIRGIGGNRVLTQIDGVPTAEQFSFGPLGTNQTFLDLDAIDSVEIVRNAGSSLYGSDALGGVVSVVTKDPADYLEGRRFSLRLRTAYDSRDEELSESATGAFGGERWQGSLLVTRRDGHEMDNQGDRETANASRTTPNPQDRAAANALGKLVYSFNESTTWKLGIELMDGTTDTQVLSSQGVAGTVNTAGYDAVDDVERRRLSLERSVQRQGGLFQTLLVRFYAQDTETEQNTAEQRITTAGGRTTRVLRDGLLSFEQDKLGGEAQAIRAFEGRVPTLLTYGLSVSRDHFDQLRDRTDTNLDTGAEVPGFLPYPTKYFPESDVTELGGYVQAEMTLADGRLKLVPGLRYDRFDLDAAQDDPIFLSGNPGAPPAADLTDAALSPRLSLVWSPALATAVYVQYARGFRAPPYSDVNNGFTNLASGYTTLPNPDLAPETSDSYEIGVRSKIGKASFSLAVFDNRYDDFIETVTLGVNSAGLIEFQPQNLTAVRISGVELAGDVAFSRNVRLRSAFSLIDGENETADTPLNSIAPAKLVLGLQLVAPSGRYGAELIGTAVAKKDVDDVDRTAVAQYAPDGYELFDLLAFYDITERLGLQVGLLNLTDETYWDWANARGIAATSAVLDRYTSPGRSAVAAVRWRW
jgi:hemoglobin/transferrin/lactoferrin receptor protein